MQIYIVKSQKNAQSYWRQYSKNKLFDMLSILDWNINVDDVQE